ncbi:MAG: ABC-type transport auxiliary lipoprotein family protein [Xanthobacteraceae bacterium]
MSAVLIALSLFGCAGGDSGLQTFELIAPKEFGDVRAARGSLSVALPTALQALDSERVVVQPSPGVINYLGGARWSDRLPRIVQARIVEAFENGKRIRAVVRGGGQFRSDFQLVTELREFGVLVAGEPTALVDISARIVNERTGRVVAAQVFSARAETSSVDGPSATAAINTAFGIVLIDLVRWTSTKI